MHDRTAIRHRRLCSDSPREYDAVWRSIADVNCGTQEEQTVGALLAEIITRLDKPVNDCEDQVVVTD
jgi:hypothetical protein